jgi:hypothetical protein
MNAAWSEEVVSPKPYIEPPANIAMIVPTPLGDVALPAVFATHSLVVVIAGDAGASEPIVNSPDVLVVLIPILLPVSYTTLLPAPVVLVNLAR